MPHNTELDDMIEHEKRLVAFEYQGEAWAGGLSDGIDAEIMAEAAIATAIGQLMDAVGEDAVLDYVERLKGKVVAGEFVERTLQ